ncbi:hypothetical protein DSM106972_023970 [Dulcicalothrix desertica PCC 7102]|uniref:Uncharacterized protein n=1 Tax=Dulcicalothrix desertica PCC 7102 TaxID=232991 RepID=A0A433VM13_9CYAN|nr:hypothetical protein [Dulcicalothrix desertica]RUT07136.1 hypothetical protein DSM106972_023970 [Dulcicalothrix desertica PCC 7102]TWH61867.1 hypothetical protein CAL7102_00545 [Dulcicalothrix desertica PCC 7102]
MVRDVTGLFASFEFVVNVTHPTILFIQRVILVTFLYFLLFINNINKGAEVLNIVACVTQELLACTDK